MLTIVYYQCAVQSLSPMFLIRRRICHDRNGDNFRDHRCDGHTERRMFSVCDYHRVLEVIIVMLQ